MRQQRGGGSERAPGLLRSYTVTHGPGPVRFPQEADWHQFVRADVGVVRVDTEQGSWTLPPERGLWVSAGVEHRATVVQRATMRTLYLPAGHPLLPDDVAVVEMTPIVRALVDRLVERAPVPLDDSGLAWFRVLAEEVQSLDTAPVALPAIRREPAATVARRLRSDSGAHDSIEELARAAGASRRTIERGFRAETGMTISAWRRRARLLVALEQLASGVPVGRVATDAGYATQSAFGAMFRQHFGVAPGDYFAHRHRS